MSNVPYNAVRTSTHCSTALEISVNSSWRLPKMVSHLLFAMLISCIVVYNTVESGNNSFSVPSPLVLAISNNVLYASSWEPNNSTACSSKAVFKFNLTAPATLNQAMNVVYCLQCTCISGLAVDDSDGSIFISDVMSFYLYRLDKNGRLLNQLYLGAYPSVINKIGSDGHLYVTTIGSPFTLNVYTKSLTLVSSYELPPGPNYLYATIDKENNLYVQSNDPTLLYVYNKSGIFMKSINPGLKAESIFVDENDNLLASGINSKGEKLVNVVFEGTVSKSVKITEGSIGGITAYSSKVYVAQFKRNVVESFDYNAK